MRHGGWIACLLCLCGPAHAIAQVIEQAWVSWVMDGDTLLLLPQGQTEPVKWRLEGIDAPESCQPGGVAARDALIALTLRKTVQVQDSGQDVYGRHIGRLWVDGLDVGAQMVRTGMAWAWQHRAGRGPYAALQRQARQARLGLFAERETAMIPAVFRQFHGSCLAPGDEDQAPVARVPQTGQSGSR